MPLDKAIEHNKEKRRQYYRSKRFDRSCRNHGSCGYCLDNRMHKFRKAEPVVFDEEFKLNEIGANMINEFSYSYNGYDFEYTVIDITDDVFKCTGLMKLPGDTDHLLLANSDEKSLLKDFEEKVDEHLERVLDLTQELEHVSKMKRLFDHILFSEAQPVFEYMLHRETMLIMELKVLTSD